MALAALLAQPHPGRLRPATRLPAEATVLQVGRILIAVEAGNDGSARIIAVQAKLLGGMVGDAAGPPMPGISESPAVSSSITGGLNSSGA